MNENRQVIRTVKNGSVRIYGKDYQPDGQHMPYDGRLEGVRLVFGRYKIAFVYEPFVSLWGTEEMKKTRNLSVSDAPYCVNGNLPWVWWRDDGKVECRQLPHA